MIEIKKPVRKITVSIPDELDDRLRVYSEKNYGGMKGSLSMTVIRALEEYLKKEL